MFDRWRAPNKPTTPVALKAAITDREFMAAGKFRHRGHEPREELIVRLYGRARAPGMIAHLADPTSQNDATKGCALDPRGKDIKIQGVKSVRPTRKPRLKFRTTVVSPKRLADRRFCGSANQEPPRTTRIRASPPFSHADPSIGAPS
jgi:hypothetical protein